MIDLSFLERRIWYHKPNIGKEDYILLKIKDKYKGFIYKYIETDIGLSRRIKSKIKKK